MKQILLIETEFYARVRMDDDLAEQGYQVTSVRKVRDAFFKLKAQMFHLLMVSYDQEFNMVLRLLATLRQGGNTIPVVILAKKPTEAQLVQMLAFRPIEVIVKPYALTDLVDRIQTITHGIANDR